MNLHRLIYSAMTVAALLITPACGESHADHDHEAHEHHDGHDDHEHDGHDDHDDDHDDHDADHDHDGHGHEGHVHISGKPTAFGEEIALAPETAARFGVVVDTIVPGTFHQVLKVTGRIIDNPAGSSVVSAPTSGIVRYASSMEEGRSVASGTVVATISAEGISGGDSNLAGKAAIEAAQREVDRLSPLYQDGIVSARDYNAALQALELARAQYSPAAASGQARAVSAGVISQLLVANGQYVETGTPIAIVSANRRLTLRADVPDRHAASIPLMQGASIVLPSTNEAIDLSALGGTRISAAEPSARQQAGYIPVYFSFDNNGKTMPRTLVDVYLTGAPRPGVLAVPVEAVTEQQGHHFVYVQVDEEGYMKTPVTLGASDGHRVEIVSGLQPGTPVVVSGAGAVRLAETSGAVPEGHSHSH